MTSQTVTVLGAGAWGIVLAAHLSRKGHSVVAWDYAPPVIDALRETRSHPKLPAFGLPPEVRLTADLEEAMKSRAPDCVVVAVPSHGMRALVERCRPLEARIPDVAPPWVLCSKGIEEETLLPMTGVVQSVRGDAWRSRLAALSGPSFAAEVAAAKPTTVCVASHDPGLARYVQSLFMTDSLRIYTQDDVLGVELGGALKNVIAIAAGACDGMDLGDNARAALITRGLAEIVRLGVAMGARPETFAGLAGLGDLILTCNGALSRNHQFGVLLARGRTCAEALAEIGMVVEGVRTARSARALAERHGVEMPITREVSAVINEGKSPAKAVRDLMRREARPERD
ncbi:MAG TPA: NAD(P)H-dependent glycerol-3-phosphate dehydrogenase [Sumerlaeia bacterium]|nr:NAD(P)H-dependent glycerol-3-phosphate dehydrogenase [Sumerlaeia bacterium]